MSVFHEMPKTLFVVLFMAARFKWADVIRCPRRRHGSQPRMRLKVSGRMLPIIDPSLSRLAFSVPVIWSVFVRSHIFHPYDLVRHCQVLNGQVRHFQHP